MVADHAEQLRAKLETWGDAKVEILVDAEPDLPDELGDRQQDSWEPLLAIADLAGEEWPERARTAAVELHGSVPDEESAGILLLRHLREAFGENERLSTAELLRALIARDDGPWALWWARDVEDGKTRGPAARMAKMLKPFAISSKNLKRSDGTVVKGFERAAFNDSWLRYLPEGRYSLLSRSEGISALEPSEAKSASDLQGYDVATFLGEDGATPLLEPETTSDKDDADAILRPKDGSRKMTWDELKNR